MLSLQPTHPLPPRAAGPPLLIVVVVVEVDLHVPVDLVVPVVQDVDLGLVVREDLEHLKDEDIVEHFRQCSN